MILDRFTNHKAEELKRDRAALTDILQEAGAVIRGSAIRCPFCDDKHPSAGIYQADGDGYRYKCHKCNFNGSILDVIAKLDGLDTAEVFRQLKGNSPTQKKPPKIFPDIEALKAAVPGTVEDVYQYTNPKTGKPDMIVIRAMAPDGKIFRQARSEAGGYVMQAPPKPWPLYNRARIQTADTIVVAEGEQCVHVLHKYTVVATTSPAGAGKAQYADWTPLAGKNIVLWPDADETGRAYMAQVETKLQQLKPTPRITLLEPADLDLQDKDDAVDFIAQLETLHTDKAEIQAAILEALSRAKPRGITSGVQELIEDTIAGRREAVRWPWVCIGGLTKALLPGTVTIICGNVGASKSFMLLEAAAYWHEYKIKIAVYELEEDRDFHLSRCLAQKSQVGSMTDPDWVRENPIEARRIYSDNEAFLENFGACIFASPDTHLTLEQLSKWTQGRAKAGCRIIAIDPITAAAHKSRNVWEEDNSFLHDIKRTATDYHCSVILVTHPIKAVSLPDVTQLAGGAAYQRFAQTILWLESHIEKNSQVKTSCGTIDIEHNRIAHLLKARNGKGQGVKIAFNFDSESLTLHEQGIIIKKEKLGAK
ncbi:AAA family ATPase [Planctomycetota bacterium]